MILIIISLRLLFGIAILPSRLLPNREFYAKKFFSKTDSCREAAKNSKKDLKPQKKSLTRMEEKVIFEVYDGTAKNLRHKATEPNQALQRMNMLVTDRAPSSTLRAKRVHR